MRFHLFCEGNGARWLFLAVAGFVGLALLPASDAQQEEPRMVDLNVVALDSHGQAVTDLTREELRVTDNGKPQTIAFFHHRDSALGAVPTLGTNEFSNRRGANVPRATVILFDLMNEKFGTRGTTASQLVHFLGSLESADYLYLYCVGIDGRLYPVHGLPGPEDRPEEPGVPWTRQIKPLLDAAMRALTQTRPVDEVDPTYRVQLTFQALDQVASELSRVPGRKSLVWLTDGVPIELGPNRSDTGDFVDFTPLVRQMSEVFDRFNTAIYPVRTVMMGSPQGMGGAGTSGIGSIDTLEQFADLTGGRPDAGKDIGAAVRQAMIDMRTSYQVGYFPPAANWDNKLHKLRITCTRKGVRIQAKTAYYAWSEAPGARSEQAINSVMPTTFDASEIGLHASLSRDKYDANGVHLDAHIDARDIVLVHSGDTYDGELRLAVAGYAVGAQAVREPTIPMDLHLSEPERDKALKEGISFEHDMTLPEGTQTVRLIVFDRGSEAIGTLTLPVPPKPRR